MKTKLADILVRAFIVLGFIGSLYLLMLLMIGGTLLIAGKC